MVMTDVSGTRGAVLSIFLDRADALGKLSISYGIGMIVGPTIGVKLSTIYSEQFAAGKRHLTNQCYPSQLIN